MRKALLCLIFILIVSCNRENPNRSSNEKIEIRTLDSNLGILEDATFVHQKIYVPIYSDIYQKSRSERTLLTATLSIRNTSEFDSIFLSRVDYFNTEGDLVNKYLDSPIYLKPMETIDYVIEERDTSGGSGANFILEWHGKSHLNPIFQAIMIGGLGNKVFSFTTEGKLIEE